MFVPFCKIQLCQLDQIAGLIAGKQAGLAGYELVNQHGQAGHEAGSCSELVNQHGQAGHEAGSCSELVNQQPAVSKPSLTCFWSCSAGHMK